jgi:pyruvate kinase
VRRETVADGIVAAAREIAETTNIKAICCFSQSGTTVSLVARERPHVPIIALTPLMSTLRRLCLTWGAHCVITRAAGRFKGAVIWRRSVPRATGLPTEEDQIVVTAGRAVQRQGHHEHPARRHLRRAIDFAGRPRISLSPASQR